jgi:thioredoxin
MAVAQADTPLLIASAGELEGYLASPLPILLYLWGGETLRADVKTELEKVAREQRGRILVIKADASRAPEAGEYFELGKHPLLIGWFNGEQLGRRSRPWATDIQGMVDVLLVHAPAAPAGAVKEKEKDKKVVETKPIKVTEATFEKDVLKCALPVLVDFWAGWCEPCKQVAPILEKLAAEFAGKVRIAKVDVDANQNLAQAFRVMSIPTLMFVKGGKIVGQQAGALPEHILRDAINQLIKLEVPA